MRKIPFTPLRKITFNRLRSILLWLSLTILAAPAMNAANYEWKGNDNTDWNVLNNWRLGNGNVPTALPGAGDVILINGTGGANAIPVLSNNVTISSLTINDAVSSSGGIDLGGFTLNASALNISVGTISNGFFDISGNVNISGGTFTSIDIDGGNFPTLSNATFTNDVILEKTGGNSMGSPGDGMTYEGNFTFIHNGSGNVRFGRNGANSYGTTTAHTATFTNNSPSGIFGIGESNTATFSGDVIVNNSSTNSGAIQIGNAGGSGGATIPGNFTISSSAGGVGLFDIIENGPLNGGLGNISGSAFEADNCIFSGNFDVNVTGSISSIENTTFKGTGTNSFTAGSSLNEVNNSVFAGPTTFTNAVAGSTPWDGGNTFNGNASFIRTGSSSNNWRLDDNNPNTFGSPMNPVDVVIDNGIGTGEFSFAEQTATFYGSLTVTGNPKSSLGPVIMAGTAGQQSIFGSNDGWVFPNFTVSNPDGVDIPFSFNVSSSLNLSGILEMPASETVSLGGGAAFSGSASGYISGGALFKEGNTATNSSPPFTFHVGADGFYAPFSYTTNNSGGNPDVTVQYFHTAPTSGTLPSPIETVSQTEHWTLDVASQTIGNTLITLPYGPQSGLIGDISDLRVAFSSDGGSNWNDLGGAAAGGSITASNADAFVAGSSYIVTLASVNVARTPLPVELVSFTAKPKDNCVILEWATANELNNDYFQVERSSNGSDFQAVGDKIDGAGTTNEPLNYEFIDTAPLSGISYYRLKQVDFDGQHSYSDVKAVQIGNAPKGEMLVFPNPTRDLLQIRWEGDQPIDKLRFLDASGQLLSINALINDKQAEINLNGLPAGMYFLELLSGKERKIQQVIISQ